MMSNLEERVADLESLVKELQERLKKLEADALRLDDLRRLERELPRRVAMGLRAQGL